MEFIEKQWKLIVGAAGFAVLVGVVITVVSIRATQKEKSAQESYFTVEKKLNDLKNQKPEAPTADKKAKPKSDAPIDYTQIKKDLEKVSTDFPGSIASQMAALHVANILVDEKNTDAALATLQKVENKDRGLVNTLVQQQIGQLLADKQKCPEAIAIWQKIIERREAGFIHNETKLQQALCYSKMNDFKRAEEILTNLANQTANPDMSNSATSKEAEKYLRLIQFKKASGT